MKVELTSEDFIPGLKPGLYKGTLVSVDTDLNHGRLVLTMRLEEETS